MARLIDADKLKAHYSWWKDGTREMTMGEAKDIFDEIVDLQPTSEKRGEWIPVTEQLPEKDGYYLTTTCYRQVYCDFWNADHFDRTEAVIAWMFLPKPYEPPKEEENETD